MAIAGAFPKTGLHNKTEAFVITHNLRYAEAA
jgi:hypothetical protein